MAAVIGLTGLTGLTKRYGATVGIQQLDLEVEAGEVFGFLGPNGAGKTTTIRCMVGLLSPTAGTARVLGLDPIADHARLTRQLGYLPGELRLYGELCQRLELTGLDLSRPVAEYSPRHEAEDRAGAGAPA
jgi:ABC-2 type transport system ATP-binding protein